MNFWLFQFELRVRPILIHISLRQEYQLVAAGGRNFLRRLTATTTGSKPAEGMAVRLLCLLCDFGTSKTTRPSPDLGCSTTEKKKKIYMYVRCICWKGFELRARAWAWLNDLSCYEPRINLNTCMHNERILLVRIQQRNSLSSILRSNTQKYLWQ